MEQLAIANNSSSSSSSNSPFCVTCDEDEVLKCASKQDGDKKEIFNIHQRAQFSISSPDRKRGLSSIIENLKVHRFHLLKDSSPFQKDFYSYGTNRSPDLPVASSESLAFLPKRNGESVASGDLDSTPTTITKTQRHRRRTERPIQNGQTPTTSSGFVPTDLSSSTTATLSNNNNNNSVKNERLSPGTTDTSNSRSVTPSSISARDPDTPPAPEHPAFAATNNNRYSDIMRSLAARYNSGGTTDYFARNGFPPPLDHRLKTPFSTILPPHIPHLPSPSKEDLQKKQPDISPLLSHFAGGGIFSPMIDMSSTQTLMALMRTAKEAELQNLVKNVKRPDPTSPLDLSAAAPPMKRARVKTSSGSSTGGLCGGQKRPESTSPRLQEDISCWSVEDVCNFVSSIDICAEYAQNFREQRIDGTGLPLLTEEHLTSTINMKLGPALKLKSILAKKFGTGSNNCSHCSGCRNSTSGSPDPTSAVTGNTSDSGGNS